MLSIDELKQDRDLVNSIDWEMTPEKAVEMYLEWGTGWVRGNDFVSSNDDESVYFVLYDWEDNKATLVRRTVHEVVELAKISVPKELFVKACEEDGMLPGGTEHRLNNKLIDWLSSQINGAWRQPELIH